MALALQMVLTMYQLFIPLTGEIAGEGYQTLEEAQLAYLDWCADFAIRAPGSPLPLMEIRPCTKS